MLKKVRMNKENSDESGRGREAGCGGLGMEGEMDKEGRRGRWLGREKGGVESALTKHNTAPPRLIAPLTSQRLRGELYRDRPATINFAVGCYAAK